MRYRMTKQSFLYLVTYHIPQAPAAAELEVKKSRFIARAHPIQHRQQALEIVQQLQQEFPDARHICWAYVLGNQVSAAMSDDGEPSGTAGKPILNVLQHKRIGDVLVAVVRYFGGIKLGAGGLVRAYSGAAQLVVDALQLAPFVATCEVTVSLDFAREQVLRHWCQIHNAVVLSVSYADRVTMQISLLAEQEADLQAWCEGEGATYRSLDVTS